MTKSEAITEAIKRLDATGCTQFVNRRGSDYELGDNTGTTKRGWKPAEMISRGNVHAYRREFGNPA